MSQEVRKEFFKNYWKLQLQPLKHLNGDDMWTVDHFNQILEGRTVI